MGCENAVGPGQHRRELPSNQCPPQAVRLRDRPGVTLGQNTPRTGQVEFKTWRIKARPIQARIEEDGDIHLVVGAPHKPSKTMIVEFPKKICVESRLKRHKIAAAREKFLNNCGKVTDSDWTKLQGKVEIIGVCFWDAKHGQTRVAPNGIELHPVLNFQGDCSKRSTSGGGGGGGNNCDPSYPTVCIPSPPPDLDCGDIPYTNFAVRGDDPHGFDGDDDGVGCET